MISDRGVTRNSRWILRLSMGGARYAEALLPLDGMLLEQSYSRETVNIPRLSLWYVVVVAREERAERSSYMDKPTELFQRLQ